MAASADIVGRPKKQHAPKSWVAHWDDATAAGRWLSRDRDRRPPQQGDGSPCRECLREGTSQERSVWLHIISKVYLGSTIKLEACSCACTHEHFYSICSVMVHISLAGLISWVITVLRTETS